MVTHKTRASVIAVAALLGVAAVAVGSSAALIAHGSSSKPHVAAAHPAADVTLATHPSGSTGINAGATSDQQGGAVFLGVSIQESNGTVQVADVVPGGPADKAGIKQGDTVASIDGTAVATAGDIKKALAAKKPGDTVTVSVNRSGAAQSITVTLASPPQRRSNAGNAAAGRGFLGVSVKDIDDAAKQKYNLTSTDGALISQVQTGSPADMAGMKTGDVITSVNGKPVKNADGLTGILSTTKSGDSVSVTYSRAGASQSASLTLGDGPAANGNLPRIGGGGNGAPGGSNRPGANGGNTGPGGNSSSGNKGADNGRGGAGFSGLPAIGAALGQNFDRFISNETKTKDANGATHTDTTVGGVVKVAPSNNQVTVTLNGGGELTFTIDAGTKVRKGLGGSQSNALAQDDKVLVTTRDGSNTATSILVVNANGGPGSFVGSGGKRGSGAAAGQDPGSGNTPGSGANGSAGGSQSDPQGGQIHISIPGNQNITIPGPGSQ